MDSSRKNVCKHHYLHLNKCNSLSFHTICSMCATWSQKYFLLHLLCYLHVVVIFLFSRQKSHTNSQNRVSSQITAVRIKSYVFHSAEACCAGFFYLCPGSRGWGLPETHHQATGTSHPIGNPGLQLADDSRSTATLCDEQNICRQHFWKIMFKSELLAGFSFCFTSFSSLWEEKKHNPVHSLAPVCQSQFTCVL